MFVGRDREMALLRDFTSRSTAGLVVCRGRRRIGKSTLIEQFGNGRRFYEFYGLAPRKGIDNADQLKHFGELMGSSFGVPPMHFENWHEALSTLAGLTAKEETIILLDEISWMASNDKDFPGKLKGVWDTRFKKNDRLILVLCGSVTSWIDTNILNDKGFMGRVSLTLTLDELPLHAANAFWHGTKHISATEKLRLLCVTGGVPRYLEEIRSDQTAEQNIKRMCFSPEGLLFTEFGKIFRDIFALRSETFKRIVEALSGAPMQPGDLCRALGVGPTGGLSEQLRVLVAAGMLARDYAWDTSGRRTALSKYRIRDNYLRFYLRYIDPQKEKIEQGLFRDIHLEQLANWDSLMGYQFENLVLNNLDAVIRRLDIAPESILSAAPYFQRKTRRHMACQVDLLIQTKHTLYLCEVKFRKQIDAGVIHDVERKIEALPGGARHSVRPVLIYDGELAPSIKRSDAFCRLIPMADLLTAP
jgi:AAA+ ATPase superfamily predicted ATPase